jgi:hypothetical protein
MPTSNTKRKVQGIDLQLQPPLAMHVFTTAFLCSAAVLRLIVQRVGVMQAFITLLHFLSGTHQPAGHISTQQSHKLVE